MNQNIRISFSFNEWLIWFKSKNFNHKVFIFYTLVNPIINLLWSFKVPGFGKSVTSMINAVFISFLMIYLIFGHKKPILKSKLYTILSISFVYFFIYFKNFLLFFFMYQNFIS